MKEMIVTAWSNGTSSRTGAGYGLRLKESDRDAYLQRQMGSIFIDMPGRSQSLEVRIDGASFWKRCPELRSSAIGRWLVDRGVAPWPKGKPPKFLLVRRDKRHFILKDGSEDL